MIRLLLSVVLACLAAACGDYPRDAQDSTDRARDAMQVGVSHDPPFVILRPGQRPTGSEVALVDAFARTYGWDVEWHADGHERLMTALRDARLHLVVGGHTADSPWGDVGWSREIRLRGADGRYARRRVALPPGESAWHLRVDRFLHAHGAAPP